MALVDDISSLGVSGNDRLVHFLCINLLQINHAGDSPQT